MNVFWPAARRVASGVRSCGRRAGFLGESRSDSGRVAFRSNASIVGAVFLIAGCIQAAPGAVVFTDDFTSYDAGRWAVEPATANLFGSTYLGLPQSLTATTLDGNSVVRMTSVMTDLQSRGFATIDSYSFASATVEYDFKIMPLVDNSVPAAVQRNIDILMALSLFNPATNDYVQIAVAGGNYGNNPFAQTSSSLGSTVNSSGNLWSYDAYYRFVIEATPGSTHLSFRNASDTELFGATYGFDLGALGGYKIALTQFMGGPNGQYYGDAAADRLVFSAVPEMSPAVLVGVVGLSTIGVGWRRNRRLVADNHPHTAESGQQ